MRLLGYLRESCLMVLFNDDCDLGKRRQLVGRGEENVVSFDWMNLVSSCKLQFNFSEEIRQA